MFDSLFLAMLESALNSVAYFERVEYPTFQDSHPSSAVLLPAQAAHISEEGCVVYTDPSTSPPSVIRVELPSPLSPDYDVCLAYTLGDPSRIDK